MTKLKVAFRKKKFYQFSLQLESCVLFKSQMDCFNGGGGGKNKDKLNRNEKTRGKKHKDMEKIILKEEQKLGKK